MSIALSLCEDVPEWLDGCPSSWANSLAASMKYLASLTLSTKSLASLTLSWSSLSFSSSVHHPPALYVRTYC